MKLDLQPCGTAGRRAGRRTPFYGALLGLALCAFTLIILPARACNAEIVLEEAPWTGPGLFKADPTFTPDKLPQRQPAETACDRDKFEQFFAAFAEDVESQFKSTAFPLPVSYLADNPDPQGEPFIKVTKVMQRDDSAKPVAIFPTADMRKADGLKYAIKPQEDGTMLVTLNKEDTGWVVRYIFTWNNCWQLTSIDDQST